MPVSVASSQLIDESLEAVGVGLVSALPETWLVRLIRMAEDNPAMTLVRLAKEEEGGGVTEHLLDALRIPRAHLTSRDDVSRKIGKAQTLAQSASRPVARLLGRDLMWVG